MRIKRPKHPSKPKHPSNNLVRTSSHSLCIEKGRWTRPYTPGEQSLCICGHGIQDEQHVLEVCPLTNGIRLNNQHFDFKLPDFFNYDEKTVIDIVYQILKQY